MDTSSSQPLLIPRLRLTRLSSNPQLADAAMSEAPVAGPSRSSPCPSNDDIKYNGEDDLHSLATPKLASTSSLPQLSRSYSLSQRDTPADTPAARLRALLSRVPNDSNFKATEKAPASPTDLDSDFDPPRFSPTTPSIARESLKDLFSHALRDPGDTPKKGRRRRNSIDVSEVEASPRVQRERAKYKSKRRSLSDEEADKPSTKSRSESSFRSSQAATYDSLRERLANSQARRKSPLPPAPLNDHSESETSNTAPDDSNDTAMFLRELNSSHATPPEATSTPQRSALMPSNLAIDSNLLEHDSEMQKAMNSYDSFGSDSPGSQLPIAFPPPRTSQANSGGPHSALRRSHSHSQDPKPLIRHGSDSGGAPRASSSLSGGDFKDHQIGEDHWRIVEREREWNKRHPKTPKITHRHSHGNSSGGSQPTDGQPRQERSFDDDASSKASSLGSQIDHRERMSELEQERLNELEHGWNKPIPKHSRSGLDLHSSPERNRAHSHPTRPDSAHSTLSPTVHPHQSHSATRTNSYASSLYHKDSGQVPDPVMQYEYQHRQEQSWNSLHHNESDSSHALQSDSNPRPERQRTHSHPTRTESARSLQSPGLHHHHSRSSSRATSPTSSLRSEGSTKSHSMDEQHEVEHERERNWNAPRPKWHDQPGRSLSPLPPSRPHPSSPSQLHSQDHDHGRSSRPRSPLPSIGTGKDITAHSHNHARPNSPLPLSAHESDENSKSMKASASGSLHEWQFPRNKTTLPPIELDHSPKRSNPGFLGKEHSRTPSSPSPVPSSRPDSGVLRGSHIPVWSPKKTHDHAVSMSNGHNIEHKKGHRRNTTELSESAGGTPPVNNMEGTSTSPHISYHNSMHVNGAATLQLAALLYADESKPSVGQHPPRSQAKSDVARLRKTLAASGTQELSPPPSPPTDKFAISDPQRILTPSVTPRRPSFDGSRGEYKSPSPPGGLPDLPEPPSSSEDVANDTPARINANAHADLTLLKTPKPPGGWADTPAPTRRTLARSHSLPEDYDENQNDNGLATPVPSLSRAASLPPQTPAPPGAWMTTPGSGRRKSVLKVRFDVESETSVAESIDGPLLDGTQSHESSEMGGPLGKVASQVNGASEMGLIGKVKAEDMERSSSSPETSAVAPVPRSPRSPRKSPSIRVVDAFGREHLSNEGDDNRTPSLPAPSNTPKDSSSAVRIVDAMGREVMEAAEPLSESRIDDDAPLSHNEALTRVRQGIQDLALGLSDADRSGDELMRDRRLDELENVSRTARETRSKLIESLRLAKHTEDNILSKYGSWRAIKKRRFLPIITSDPRLLNRWTIWSLVAIHLLIILIMYRVATARARAIFLTTYYDPFYPDLHLYTTKPDTLRHSIVTSLARTPSWSLLSFYDTLRRHGWKIVVQEVLDRFMLVVFDWQRRAWEAWGFDDQLLKMPWPPT